MTTITCNKMYQLCQECQRCLSGMTSCQVCFLLLRQSARTSETERTSHHENIMVCSSLGRLVCRCAGLFHLLHTRKKEKSHVQSRLRLFVHTLRNGNPRRVVYQHHFLLQKRYRKINRPSDPTAQLYKCGPTFIFTFLSFITFLLSLMLCI